MTMDKRLNQFGFSDLKDNEQILFFEDKILMGDNLGRNMDMNNIGRYLNRYPIKAQFSICLLITKGEMNLRINYQDYKIEADDMVIIQQNALAQILDVDEQSEIVVMAFADITLFSSLSSESITQFFKKTQETPVFHLPAEVRDGFIRIYKMLYKDLSNPTFNYKGEALQGYMQVIISHARHWVSTHQERDNTFNGKRASQIYMRFMTLVMEHHNQHRDVSFYANEMCLTPKYMSQVILSVSGKYALDIIKDQVIFEAKALLKSHQHTIQEIADLLNFPNPSFFGRYFKCAVGCSPRHYMDSDMV